MSIELVMPSNHLILCYPLLLLPSIPPSIRVLSNESVLRMRWPKYWSFSFSIIPSKEHPGLIPFRMDWLDLLAVQGTLKSLLQHHRYKPVNIDTLLLAEVRRIPWRRAWQPTPVQFSSVAQSCPTPCDPMNYSTPRLPVHHQLPEFIQTHVH